VPVTTENAQKGATELLVSERVAEWVDGTVMVGVPMARGLMEIGNAAE